MFVFLLVCVWGCWCLGCRVLWGFSGVQGFGGGLRGPQNPESEEAEVPEEARAQCLGFRV